MLKIEACSMLDDSMISLQKSWQNSCRFGGKTPRCLLSCSVVATLWIPGCAIVRINLPMTDPWCCYIYGVPWIPSIYPLYVSIYTSTMDPMGYSAACVDFRLLLGSIKSQTTEYHMVKWIPLSTWTFNIFNSPLPKHALHFSNVRKLSLNCSFWKQRFAWPVPTRGGCHSPNCRPIALDSLGGTLTSRMDQK